MEQEITIDVDGVSGQRGPADHKRRQQILQAADEHFRLYGYRKTTLADIAKSIHLSTPYIYKFFDSKQAIGEAMCWHCLSAVLSQIEESMAGTNSPVEKLRRIFTSLESIAWQLLSEQPKIHELVSSSFEENWESVGRFREGLVEVIRKVVMQGRKAGEFERKTPLDETSRAIARMTELFYNPSFLKQTGKSQKEEALAVANVAVRSLTA
jgi:AcrR family transcriptional regulator